ncbi:major facilitator superfamily domain-containing protein [Truncatella angustata]|uniref:Major facilitator superfamily domain-containing protein n=1 Tax=Truncatella angustata TaxID=152316 RepID=A0A9P8UYI4_9PEZI|nr:major facilitator superfamily domain-containing protein [Truncatella angustata]KAH6660547.1 major facilitator superfamily domain-containing protein [Truncatella angustata]
MADVVNSEPSSENGNVLNEKVHDDTVVDWDGPDDINNPLNWSSLKRNAHVVLISIFTLYGNLASTMFAPGAAALVHEFGITSDVLAAFTVSIYLVGFALGPILISPLSEVYGRLIINQVCNVIFLAFTIGCAVSTSSAMFFVFRFLAGCACSAPMTVGGAVIADITTPEQRGKAMALWALGPLLGPVVGPIIGGFVAQRLSWRWAFWIISILAGVVFIVSIFVMKETNATILLQRKAAKLRRASGKTYLVAKGQINQTTKQILLRAILRPTRLLLFSPVVTLLSLFSALVFSLIYILFTTFPMVFETQYGFSVQISGLAYLGLGIGLGIGIVGFGATSDRVYKRLKGDGEGTPEMRLPPMMWVSPITGLGFFWYGWSAQYQVHWIVPIIGSSVIGIGALFVMMPAQIYIVDAFGPQTAASALAASAVLRTLSGAFLTLAGPPMYASLGLGWGNSLLGFLCLAFVPVPWLFYRYGRKLREKFVFEP